MKIGIIGLGLIGGSIYKALQDRHDVIGISSSVKGQNISENYNTLKACELVFVCTPMNVTLEILDKLENILPASSIVTDVASLKAFVSQKKYSYKFIPSHPMAGTENSGWESSFPELFIGAKWVLTPIEDGLYNEQIKLENVIKSMGAEIIITTPDEHDKAVALISHMPLILSQALCENIKNNKLAQELASSGFRDTTRLALSNLEMANDMLKLNQENIMASFKTLNISWNNIINNDYPTKAKAIKDFRQNLYK